MSMEAMRYLTRTDPPVAAASYHVIELADGADLVIGLPVDVFIHPGRGP